MERKKECVRKTERVRDAEIQSTSMRLLVTGETYNTRYIDLYLHCDHRLDVYTLECPSGLPGSQGRGPARFDYLISGQKPGPSPIPRLSLESVIIKGSNPGPTPFLKNTARARLAQAGLGHSNSHHISFMSSSFYHIIKTVHVHCTLVFMCANSV